MLLHLGLTDRAAAAAGVAGVAPLQFLVLLHPLGNDPLELGALRAVHRRDVGEVVRGGRPVAEDEVDLLAGGDAVRLHLLGVGRELEQGADLGVAGELGVVDLVGTLAVAEDEVREADEARTVGGGRLVEGGLVEDVGAGSEGVSRFGCCFGIVDRGRSLELDHPTGLLEDLEVVELVLVPQACGPLEHVVVLVGQGAAAAELGVEAAEEGPLAGRPRAEVARADQDLAVGCDLHALQRMGSLRRDQPEKARSPGRTTSAAWFRPVFLRRAWSSSRSSAARNQ